ncbi:MAG: hypothetical protein IT249_11830 [Chitinophagaceae bacterium]|nr:hypothetical protein [Chitinophagaceae bacterium]
MERQIENMLRSLRHLLAETEKKISQIRNREFGRDIVEDLSLKDYVSYFEATINQIKDEIFSFNNIDSAKVEFQKLSLIEISSITTKRPFNIFAIFNEYLEGGASDINRMNYNEKILTALVAIESHCQNLIYFLNLDT